MKVDGDTARVVQERAASVLTGLVQEDRNEARIWRARVQNLSFSAVLASFAISAFFIGKVTSASLCLFRLVTLLVDCSLVAMLASIYFLRVRPDLVELRKAQKYREKLLVRSVTDQLEDFDPFKNTKGMERGLGDADLDWICGLSLFAISVKTIVVTAMITAFLSLTQTH
jgi:hypothetical protein